MSGNGSIRRKWERVIRELAERDREILDALDDA
jgi:hypothetical protein